MTDEKYLYISDVADKKRTARGIHNKRTHAGKGGKVKFPSDYMTSKELKQMSGEVITYNLNSPMTWAEFKILPEDLQRIYVSKLRERYHVSDSDIYRMLGTSVKNGQMYFSKRSLTIGTKAKIEDFRKDEWFKWVNGISATATAGEKVITEPTPDDMPETEPVEPEAAPESPCVPLSGEITFESTADNALRAVAQILNGSFVRLTVKWESVGGKNNG